MPVRTPNLRQCGAALLSLLIIFGSTGVVAQTGGTECAYDKSAPSLESARRAFKVTNYECAELELNDLLKDTTLTLKERADAHVLLAAVYYATLRDKDEKQSRVMEQFVAAFKSYRDWRGELDIRSPEFLALMQQAQQSVDAVKAAPKVDIPEIPISVPDGCPGMMVPLLGTGAFVGSAVWFMSSSGSASDKWTEYEESITDDRYDSYKSAAETKRLAGGAMILTGAVTGYLWYRYLTGKKECGQSEGGLSIRPQSDKLLLTYTF
ncbi:MAG: hypothetical protein JSU65_12565 [Candidatus Zixiibacteriota bacterium]|nr:MAG: hypothetical protein JSU65_12565 [candidate division Zixibacteria bacterium]